jgi:tRNA(Ile)-lysidine synthase
MPASRALGKGLLQRPLLAVQNDALREYLNKHNIDWLEDPSNQILRHDRNFLRHQIIPLLETRWPNINKRLLLTSKAMSAARQTLEKTAQSYLDQHLKHSFVLHITHEINQDPALFNLVIRWWLKQRGTSSLPVYHLQSLHQQLQQAREGNQVTICWHGWQLRWYKNQLWLRPDTKPTPCPSLAWPNDFSEIDLQGDGGKLKLEGQHGFSPGSLAVCGRQSCNSSSISYGNHHRSLKNLFQSAQIPAWLRNSIPLCTLADELVAVGDWCINERFASLLSENELRLQWCPQDPLLQYVRNQQHSKHNAIDG